MNEGIVLTLPRYDIVTEYLSAFSDEIQEAAKDRSVPLKPLKDKEVTKSEFEKVMKKLNYKMVVFNGHGSKESIYGHNDAILVTAGENSLVNRIIYARSCEAASVLGRSCAEASEGCFIGYDSLFEFYFDSTWATNPKKDNIAYLFLEPSNLIPISLIKGNSAEEAYRKSKNKILKNIKKVVRSRIQESPFIAESLWNNYFGQVLLGNKSAKL